MKESKPEVEDLEVEELSIKTLIFLQEAGSQEIKLVMVQSAVSSVFCLLPVIGSIYHPSHLICHGNQFHLHHPGSVMTHQCCRHGRHLGPIEMLHEGSPHSTWSSFSHPGEIDEDIIGS